MSDTVQKNIPEKNTKPKDSFGAGLFSLMTKQCIFSALIFGAIYTLKNINLPFSQSVCSIIKNIFTYDMSAETIKNILSGLFI